MRINTIAIVLAIAGISSMAQADTCPEVSKIKRTDQGFVALDESGRKWEGDNPTLTSIDENKTVFESATYITEDEDETGPISVSQMSCRYKNIALVIDNVKDWKPISQDEWKSNHCTKSINECSFSTSNK